MLLTVTMGWFDSDDDGKMDNLLCVRTMKPSQVIIFSSSLVVLFPSNVIFYA